MAIRVKLKNSVVANKAPLPTDLEIGEVAINANASSPAAYIKDTAGNVVKLAGSGAIGGTPATETAAGIVELATAAETTTGTDATRAVHPAGLKVELDKKANLASPALTGTPTAPTAAAGNNSTQIATTAFVTAAVSAEDLWDRTGTEITPKTAGDNVFVTGDVNVGGTTAAPNIKLGANGTASLKAGAVNVDTSGRLLVGTSSTSTSELLQVAGDIKATGTGPHFFGMMPNVYTVAIRTTSQNVSALSTIVFNSELKDPYGLYNASTGIFTVTASTTGTYLVFVGLNAYSLQNPSGESTFLAGIYKNDTTPLQYQEIWETTNPDETRTGMSLVTVAQLNTTGDNIRIKAQIVGSSHGENIEPDSSLTILRLF